MQHPGPQELTTSSNERFRFGKVKQGILALIGGLGETPEREGLRETPSRAARAWQEWTKGYDVDPAAVLKTFVDGAAGADEMVIVSKIPFYSHCEHHLAPFFGEVDVGYLPNGHIVGLSKIPRIVQAFSQRLQVQERLTTDIAEALHSALEPRGVGVVVRARHLCMESRGIRTVGSHTTTSKLFGLFLEPQVRQEFLALSRQPHE
jgi:GTP cyclohydrolase I